MHFPSILTNAKLTLLCAHVFTEGMENFGSDQDRKISHFLSIGYSPCLSRQFLEGMQRHRLTTTGKGTKSIMINLE